MEFSVTLVVLYKLSHQLNVSNDDHESTTANLTADPNSCAMIVKSEGEFRYLFAVIHADVS